MVNRSLQYGAQQLRGNLAHPIEPFGSAYLAIPRRISGTTVTLKLVSEDTGRFHVEVLVKTPEAWRLDQSAVLSDSQQGQWLLEDLDQYEETVVIVTNITDGCYDPDTSAWTGRPLTYEFLSP